MSVHLSSVFSGVFAPVFDRALMEIKDQKVVERIWAKDHTVWKPSPEEITNRLGWLNSFEDVKDQWPDVADFVARVRVDGYNRAILLGMGGSSLAPEIFRKICGFQEGFLDLSVCDTTAPAVMAALAEGLECEKTLFIVSTKSGGTVETLSAMKYFFRFAAEKLGKSEAGRRFVAITDPGSKLAETAATYQFRHIFYGDPNIGGRYSALSVFGLVPAALIGVDVKALLKRTADDHADAIQLGVKLGVMLGALAKAGRNKVTYLLSWPLLSFGDWVEQLIAESTGKEGKGILPVVGEPLGAPAVYGPDRFFVRIALKDKDEAPPGLAVLKEAGHPVAEMLLDDLHDLGAMLYTWEVATAVAGQILSVNPFDQPDVEAAKQFTRQVIARMQESAAPAEQPIIRENDIAVYGKTDAANTSEALAGFLASAKAGDYIALQAYLPMSASLDMLLADWRLKLRDRYRVATTVGYGPRFLHSTGQLHKGDDGSGLFIQLTADNAQDVAIPDEMTGGQSSLTFGILQIAQARGDAQALESRGRRVIRVHFTGDIQQGIEILIQSLKR
jgi:glucose-6-phosphate isomerase